MMKRSFVYMVRNSLATKLRWPLIIFLLSCLLTACHHDSKKTNSTQKTYQVKAEQMHKVLHFSGIIQPITENSMTSPIEAVVETMNVHYGQRVKKGDVVLKLSSNELQKQYNEALTDYLKAKDSYSVAKAKFTGTEELWHSGLIAKNNYLSEKSSVDTARVTLMQSRKRLKELLDKIDEHKPTEIASLNLADFNKIKSILNKQHHLIQLRAPASGVMLYPPKSNDDKSLRISVGAMVKSGQVLALIGNLHGVSVEIDVPEVDISKIHTGMGAKITGVAFGKQTLKGKVVAVNAQASGSSNGGLPSFNAVVEAKSLTKEQEDLIKVGMSASVELQIDSDKQLLIPVPAVFHQQGRSMVKVQTPEGNVIERPIATGTVQDGMVVVEMGLKQGDVVVYE